MTTAVKSNKIYFREQFGYFQSIRRKLAIGLIVLFILLPFVRYQSEAALNINVAAQTIRFFAITLYPQDLMIVGILFILAAFMLFYITRLYGRVWCGYTCPQTIWMLMFNWIERRIEGSHQQSKVLDKSGLNIHKIFKKVLKHSIWLLIAWLTACTFISYFVPVEELYFNLFNFKDYFLTQNWIIFFTVCTYINAGWVREKMCLHMCPYARFQSVLFDNHTKLVSYDEVRGESRGARKRNQIKSSGLGDCIDCKLCVDVCPVGIDIRNGLQYECINCGLCIDACDSVMDSFNYPRGLIKYNNLTDPVYRWKPHLTYGSVTLLAFLSLLIWIINRSDFEVDLQRDRNALYRVNYAGTVENTYTIKVLNKSQNAKEFQVTLQDNSEFVLEKQPIFRLLGGQSKTQVISVSSNSNQPLGKKQIVLQVTDLTKQNINTIYTRFYSPKQ
ncbi:cytochrome c oxidase accessory protein CcoG [Catenovulum sp. 2E275]|uniref:cytochrome c oxidase accessory protein CcoG n=1 Tax=Catenovulum sp. 2E275 TaxID=2980497 RepID=UPI0021CF2A2F|nr:cytochrome c oxidase accessory protein CcoG [Catenovulum sp. 2E275]MCU4675254.1 cytochrome c oxidase accessory protein CcoG [Catenovulum sp. 2E275]